MRIDCGWCGAVIKVGKATEPCSHGICERCLRLFREAIDTLTTRAEREKLAPLDPRD